MRPSSVHLLLASALVATPAAAAPIVMSHNGFLLDHDDKPVDAERLDMRFSLYDVSTPHEGEQPKWDSGTTPCAVRVLKGHYSVSLGGDCGSGLSSDALPLAQPRFLQIAVNGAPMLPRLRVGQVPTAAVAFSAEKLGELTPADLWTKAEDVGAAKYGAGTLQQKLDALRPAVQVAAPLTGDGTSVASAIALAAATGSRDGFLSGSDFARFDAKVSAVSGSAPVTVTRTGADVTVAVAMASPTSDGLLSAAHYARLAALAPVATSGSYNDLSNKPALHAVATSGSYNDLANKPALHAVATSGSYDDLSNKPVAGGAMFVRWGRTTCPDNSELVYDGYAAGAHYTHGGSGSSSLCLAKNPTWDQFNDANNDAALIYGTEYETNNNAVPSFTGKHDYEAPCAVCRATGRPSSFMYPGRNVCPTGWTTEYQGYLMASAYNQGKSDWVCVDRAAEVTGSNANHNGNLWYTTEAECGSLPCGGSGYIQNRELTCSFCTR